MKGRIGKYKDKIVVWGDPNLTAKNEINIDSLGEGGGQGNTPVEYYKVVALEGENLNEVRRNIYLYIGGIIDYGISSFHLLVKGTSTITTHNKFIGLPMVVAAGIESASIHAYEIGIFQAITKIVNENGTIREIPSFNNIFDAVESLEGMGTEAAQLLKTHLVPITAEEFYNLDDLK